MHKQKGLSLVELMISIALGLVLMTGVVQMFLSSRVVFSTQQGLSRIQETGRLAMDFMARDIRMAAYYGCYRPRPRDSLDNPDLKLQGASLALGGLHTDFDVGVIGYDNAAALPVGSGISPTPNTNILVIRGATESGSVVSAPNNATSLFGYTAVGVDPVTNCVGNLCPGDAAVIASCATAIVFQISTLGVNANVLTVNHTAAWNVVTNPLLSFTSGEILPMNTTVYFLANGAGGSSSLWQKTNTSPAVELLEGVENMRLTYALPTNTNYRPASTIAVNDWPDVNSVQIEIVVRSLENNVLAEAQPYTFGGVDVNPAALDPTDRHMRQVFKSAVSIRSR